MIHLEIVNSPFTRLPIFPKGGQQRPQHWPTHRCAHKPLVKKSAHFIQILRSLQTLDRVLTT